MDESISPQKSHVCADEVAPWHAAVVGALVALVTSGRLALLSAWPDYRAASDRSNKMAGLSHNFLTESHLSPVLQLCKQAMPGSYAMFGLKD